MRMEKEWAGEREQEGRAGRSGRMKVDVKQQEMLERFFVAEKTWFANNIFYKYCGFLLIGNGGRYVLELPCRIHALYLRHQHVVLPLYDLQGTERSDKICQ